MMSKDLPKLHAVIGVWTNEAKTFYVQRSEKMENYPLVWSLLSIQFPENELADPQDLSTVQGYMEKMSAQRMNGTPVRVMRYLSSDNSARNPISKHVFLHLYQIEFLEEPKLNPDYYVNSEWLTFEGYERKAAGGPCGLCMRMWGDYAYLHGIIDRPFSPPTPEELINNA
ncbi:MAG: hypothetical protein AAF614_23935 [Chloroflexota bacterium]